MRPTNVAKMTVGLLALTTLAACILSESRHTLYLEPDGSVEWVILQTDIRASGTDAENGVQEERAYLETARRGAHPAAEGLRELGARSVRTEILRQERPYAVETTARFRAADDLFEDFFRKLDVECDARFRHQGKRRQLTVRLSGIEPEAADALDEDDPALALIEADWRIALTAGRFVDVQGFVETDHDDTVLLSWETLEGRVQPDGTLTLSLTWELD